MAIDQFSQSDSPGADPAANAKNGASLHFEPIELSAVREGMVLRFQEAGEDPMISTVRKEYFSPVDEAFVADAVYRDARLTELYRCHDYAISVLVLG